MADDATITTAPQRQVRAAPEAFFTGHARDEGYVGDAKHGRAARRRRASSSTAAAATASAAASPSSPTRNTAAAKRFLGKALTGLKDWERPTIINTDKAPTYAAVLAELKREGKCPGQTLHRQVKYLNNVIEADHGKLKQLIRPVRGFKTLKTAHAAIKGFEVTHALRK